MSHHGSHLVRGLILGACCAGALGCAETELPGHMYAMNVVLAADECNNPEVPYSDSFEYRLVTSGATAKLYMGEGLVANGTANGCEIKYRSAQIADRRENGTIWWTLNGEAMVDRGDGCEATEGVGEGWGGEEIFTIVDSSVPEIARGCTYTTTVSGVYLGEVVGEADAGE
ncbi:MAG: hypothetical protein ACON5B_12600 [Myxococcota bacterium]